ncbi:MAG: tol-pal system protein YbgF, partial [Acidobacteriota bacterium]|nr:tol-pal system protein YbgF [Acidobacteriota bacterium]
DEKKRELAELRQRVVELQQQAAMTEIELERLRQQLAKLEGTTSPSGTDSSEGMLSPSPQAPRGAGTSDVASAPFRPEVPELEVEDLSVSERESDSVGNDSSFRSDSQSATPLGADSESLRGEASGGPGAAAGTGISLAGQALYDRGYTLFHQGLYIDAESAFQQFLGAFGTTDLADNAQFWIGESRYARKDLSGALAAFRETVTRYPTGNKVADALLKAGDCQRQLGDLGGARTTYEDVIRRYPAAAASAVAEDRLRKMP